VKFIASQATSIYKYKNLRLKLLNCNANIYYNKQCLAHGVTPAYAKIHVPITSPASTITQRKVTNTRIKDEIRYLYRKKEHLNRDLYKAHLQASNEWGTTWTLIQNSINESTHIHMDSKYKTIEHKLNRLTKQDTKGLNCKHTFFPRVVNKTNIQFTPNEELLLQKGLKYNIHSKPKNWVNTLAIEAEAAITLLPTQHQEPIRYMAAQNLKHLYTEHEKRQTHNRHQQQHELKVIKGINKKLTENRAMVTKSDKGNSLIILYLHEYNTKVQDFIANNNFTIEPTDPTKKYQTEIRKNINQCKLIVPENHKWKYINLNPSPPILKGLPKVHKTNIPIRPIVNWKNAPAYHLAKLVTDVITREIPLPNTFNIMNTIHLMTDLNEIPFTQHLHLASLDIKDMYTNIPTSTLPRILNLICKQTLAPKKFQQQLVTLLRTILKQNYFQYNDCIYKQKSGLAMGAPSSSILSELYLQYTEHTTIYDILMKHNILGYFRYVDDILIVYDTTTTDILKVLDDFNDNAHPLCFTLEREKNNQIDFLDITIKKENQSLQYEIYRKPTNTDIIIPSDSNHPSEHKLSAIRFLHNRNNSYPTSTRSKQKEQQIIQHILHTNNYNPHTTPKLTEHTTDIQQNTTKKWAKFTYIGKETRFITKLFKKTDIRITYTTKDNLRHLLNSQPNNKRDIYNKSGVYKLTCSICNKQYIGQTGRSFHIRYKEHAREYNYATNKSNYAKHLLDTQHPLKPIDECMSALHTTKKGSMLNTIERFYIHQATQNNSQLNDKNTVTPNPIFDTILQYSKGELQHFRTQ
jgi:hypothetical protein